MLEGVYAAVSRATAADWLLLASGLLLGLYLLGTWRYDFFKRRGVASTTPKVPFLGNSLKAFIGLMPFTDLVQDLYRQGKGHGVFGFFEFQRPIFMIRSPDLIKVVTVKDFDHFMNHRSVASEKSDPISTQNLFNLKDQRWKDMRTTLSPAFTTSKIKAMFPLISECTAQTVKHLHQEQEALVKSGKKGPLEVDMKDLFTRLANDVIATVAFGVGCDSQKDPKNEFYFMGKEMTTFTFLRTMIFFAYLVVPKVAEALGLRVLSERATNYFDTLVHSTIKERQQKGIFRPDMLQLLMQAREGQLKAEASEEHETEKYDSKFKLSNNDITAQAVIFFFAGFETVSTALCFTAYALSRHPDAQMNLQKEVDAMMKETGGKPTYEAIQGMKYLDAVISEALRMYPPVVAVDRTCREDFVLPATDTSPSVHIRKGDIAWMPIYALHHDPELWEEPEKFDPERFSEDNKHRIKPFSYAPFGLGPRLCIGQRFALLEVKLALVNLLANFDIHPSPKTKDPLQFEKGFNMMIRGGFWNQLIPRNV